MILTLKLIFFCSESSPRKLNKSQLDDGSMCPICFDIFTTSGEHRIVSLKCGHIFGNSCIDRWVKDQKNCPQCKTKSNTRDFRNVYATKILVVDNTREMELELQIQKLHHEKSELSAINLQNSTSIALQRRHIREMEAEISKLKLLVATSKHGSPTTCIQTIKGGRMYLEKNVDFKESTDSKLISYMTKSKKILISQKSSGSALFSGYGIRFMDAVYHKLEKFIITGPKPINDFAFDPTEAFLMSVSKENTCKLFNIDTRQSVMSFAPSESALWTCAFNKSRDNQVIFGAQNGITYIYDTKKSNEILHTIESLDRTPVKNIVAVNKTEAFPHGGFFVVQVRGLYFYEYHNGYELRQTKLNFDDSVLTATYDDKTEMLLITTAAMEQTYHILTRLVKVDDIPVLQEVCRLPANRLVGGIPKFTRPTQIKVPDGFIVACYMDESKDLQIHTPNTKLHSIVMQNAISDICPLYSDTSIVAFAALAPLKCRIYKVNLEYR